MLMTGAAVLRANKDEVNRINVFPIADNDTGENMCMTIIAGLNATRDMEDAEIACAARKIADAMIFDAQGNSGIILAKLFQGIAEGMERYREHDLKTLSLIFWDSSLGAYSAVSNPVEGTMLTVMKNASARAKNSEFKTLEEYFGVLNKYLEDELKKTPESLSILKENNVVDSGALGLVYLFRGFEKAVKGEVEKIELEAKKIAKNDVQFETKNGGFFCTNFLVKLKDVNRFEELKSILNDNGSSIVCFLANDSAKGHIHTSNPDIVQGILKAFGEVLNFKIDLMDDERDFTLFVDTSCDMTPKLCEEFDMKLISYPYTIEGKAIYPYVDFDEFDYKPFYQLMREGAKMTTFALSKEHYIEYFEPEFKRGKDIMYAHQSEAPTRTFQFMRQAVAELKEKYPNRKFYELDTKGFTASGMLICMEIGDMYKAGVSAEEIMAWAEREIDNFPIYTTAKDLSFFVRSGRIKRAEATFGNMVKMHPIVHGSTEGIMEALDKKVGKMNTYKKMLDYAIEDGIDIEKHRIVVGHSDMAKEAEWFATQLKKLFPNAEILVAPINPAIGVHCGPDNVGFAFHGKKRVAGEKK